MILRRVYCFIRCSCSLDEVRGWHAVAPCTTVVGMDLTGTDREQTHKTTPAKYGLTLSCSSTFVCSTVLP